ncbi:MAG: DUF2905 domain-containing protein [Acidobacteriota bacterium]
MNNGFPGDIGRLLVILGGVILVIGILLVVGSKFSFFGLGHLPGDIRYKGKNSTLYFPLTTCLLLSAVITLIMWLISHLTRH